VVEEWGAYARRYRIAYIIVARKNGKSELAAGIMLYMLVGDDEQSAEIYCAAKDTKQAGKVFEPALRMVQLSPVLSKRLKHIKNARDWWTRSPGRTTRS
jgi:phage terminase large subunit-like protein